LAFADCSSLSSVTLPNSLTTIGDGAFSKCNMLSEFNIDADNTEFALIDGIMFNKDKTTLVICPSGMKLNRYNIPLSVTTIGNYAFSDCSDLINVNIPNSVTTIGSYAFADCRGLTSINIPNSVTTIGDRAFSVCRGLTSFAIPNSVTKIEDGTFYSCHNLTSITIPNSIISIGVGAFSDCIGLASINIPNSVTKIGDFAFFECYNLTEIINHASIPQTIHASVFNKVNQNACMLHVPAASISAYQASDVWKEFKISSL